MRAPATVASMASGSFAMSGVWAPNRQASLLHSGHELTAGALAAPAGLCADPAVLMHLGVLLALVAAGLADGHAGLQQRLGDVGVLLGLPARDRGGGGTDVGAI